MKVKIYWEAKCSSVISLWMSLKQDLLQIYQNCHFCTVYQRAKYVVSRHILPREMHQNAFAVASLQCSPDWPSSLDLRVPLRDGRGWEGWEKGKEGERGGEKEGEGGEKEGEGGFLLTVFDTPWCEILHKTLESLPVVNTNCKIHATSSHVTNCRMFQKHRIWKAFEQLKWPWQLLCRSR